MIEYAIVTFQNFSFSTSHISPELIAHFLLFGIVLAVIGYWIKNWTGVIIGILPVLFLYCYFTGFLSSIMA